MRLKSYFVHTMDEALQAAKNELGGDAMLVESKRLEAPAGGKPRLEVVFAVPVAPPAVPKARVAAPRHGFRELRGELASLLDALSRKPDASRWASATPADAELEKLRARLLVAEVPGAVVDDFAPRCLPVLEGMALRGAPDPLAAVLPLLAAEWPHGVEARPSVLAVVGPTGAGKTSMIAKLAFRLGVSQGRPVSVVSIDNLRIGASDQLAHLCSLLGLPFQGLDFSSALRTATAAHAQRGLVLIDTPGYGAGEVDLMEELAAELKQIESLACHLVLPATLRHSEMERRLAHFSRFPLSRVLFTRLDETEYYGPAWAFAKTSGLAVDWVSTGPGIPEDVAEADASQFAAAVLGKPHPEVAPAMLARAARA